MRKAADASSSGALEKAAAGGFEDTVGVLIDYGADVGVRRRRKRTALHAASSGGHLETVRMLLSKGADPEIKDDDGKTAVQLAAENGHTNVVQLFSTAPDSERDLSMWF